MSNSSQPQTTAHHHHHPTSTVSWSLPKLMLTVSMTLSNHPLLSPSHFAFSLSQHQGLFQWVMCSVAVYYELTLNLNLIGLPHILYQCQNCGSRRKFHQNDFPKPMQFVQLNSFVHFLVSSDWFSIWLLVCLIPMGYFSLWPIWCLLTKVRRGSLQTAAQELAALVSESTKSEDPKTFESSALKYKSTADRQVLSRCCHLHPQ